MNELMRFQAIFMDFQAELKSTHLGWSDVSDDTALKTRNSGHGDH